MTFPQQNLTVLQTGIGVTAPGSKTPLFTGIATGGSQAVNTIGSISKLTDVRTVIGYGPLAEDVALVLQKKGGPVLFCIHDSADSKALTAAVLTATASSMATPPIVTVTGTPNDRYMLRVEVIVGGAVATATFRYSLDAWDVDAAPFTQSRVRATAATYDVEGSGLTINFPAGTYVAGDFYMLECVPKEPGTTDLQDAAEAVAASPRMYQLWAVSGSQPDEEAGAALAAALGGYIEALQVQNRFIRGFLDVGSDADSDDVITEAADWSEVTICPWYGYTLRVSALPFEGFATRKISCVTGGAVRASQELISSDLSRTAAGSDSGVLKIYFDANDDQGLDEVKISTMRTWSGIAGYWIANAKLKSDFGSDFTDLQFGRVMDTACRTTFEAQFPFQSASLRTIGADQATDERPAGAIDEKDAKIIENRVQAALDAALKQPTNASGVPGHVSDVVYAVDLSTNITLTGQLVTTVALRPLGYAKDIETTLYFTVST